MKKQSLYAAGASFVYFFTILCLPAAASALPDSPIMIAEVQPGSASSASEEFIELFNASDTPVDLSAHHWQLITTSASATNWTPYRSITLSGVLEPGASYVVASSYTSNGATIWYLNGLADAHFSAGLSATAGHVQLTYTTNTLTASGVCEATETIADRVEWTVVSSGIQTSPSITGRQTHGIPMKTGVPPATTLQRIFDTGISNYYDRDDDGVDFTMGTPSPGMLNNLAPDASAFTLLPITIADSCNPTPPAPSSDTGPTEPSDPSPAPTDGGTDGSGADDGTNDSDTDMPPTITELLPNPAAPQTDDADEFIEVYNPNDRAFDLSGYTLEAGGATMRRYTLPAGTVLAPHAYQVFSSDVTGISLPNSGGSARLLDIVGTVIMQTGIYSTAPDGQAWMIQDGAWRWTVSPTPGVGNIFIASPVASKKATAATAKQTVKKTTAVKAAATTKAKAKAKATAPKAKKTAAKKTSLSPVAASVRNPVHTGVLAAIGIFALLYGAYEYRHDLANKINQLRSNRAARRAARTSAARR